ncbi:MAG: divergent polysaccharide deacetylase family protein [Gammaproteobacteria bacterium]
MRCRLLCLVSLVIAPLALIADEPATATAELPAIAIIIDDLGYNTHEGERALALPGALTYSILPRTPAALQLSQRAAQLGKDVLLHLPMEAESGNAQLGPGAIILGMTREQVFATLADNLASVPNAIGVNNHMGSLLTAEREPMVWVMEALRQHGNLMYVDSRTSSHSVASSAASEQQLPFLARDVFLDNEGGYDYARHQFLHLVALAHQRGYALAIGHPRPATLQLLETFLPHVEQQGVRLVRLGELFSLQSQNQSDRRNSTWQLSSSHSPTDVKN